MVRNGIEHIERADPVLKGKRIGLITNPTGVDSRLRSSIDILREKYDLVCLFAPEHGVRGELQAGARVETCTDSATGLPVRSLFGEKTDFSGLDALVYDIQDVGLRFYTYIYVMGEAMRSCGKLGLPFVVPDRYDPLGLTDVDGAMLEDRYSSGVGNYGLPARYGLTCGELARWLNDTQGFHCPLTVVPCEGLTRETTFEEAGLPWIQPSPNLPTFDSTLCYTGTVLFEGTNISEGRGTTRPFEIIGAPFADGDRIADRMNSLGLEGVLFRSLYFRPTFSKYAEETCRGVQLHITDRKRFRPYSCGLKLLETFREFCPEMTFNRWGDTFGIDLLAGTNRIRLGTADEQWQKEQASLREEFIRSTLPCRLY